MSERLARLCRDVPSTPRRGSTVKHGIACRRDFATNRIPAMAAMARGTVPAVLRLRAPRGRYWMWIVAGPVALVRRFAFMLLSLRCMQGVIELRTGSYLDTVALLQKP
jgi:hypothetical protein